MFKKKFALFFLFAFFLSKLVMGQTAALRFKHFTTDDGLSEGSVYRMNQDSRGFMWFGTMDGLNRFDGYNFTTFRPYYHDSTSIRGSRINSIIEDKNGFLWIGTNEALNRYNFKTNQFEHFYVLDPQQKRREVRYDPFFIDDKNELWFTYTSNCLASLNLLTGTVTTYPFADGALDEFATAGYPKKVFYRPLIKIYATGFDGLRIIDLPHKTVHFYFSSNPANEFGKRALIWEALEDKKARLWLATQNGLISFNANEKKSELYNTYHQNERIRALTGLAFDKDGNLWCSSDEAGLMLFNTASNQFIQQYTKSFANPESVGGNSITSVYVDSENDIWVNTDPGGIDKANPLYEQLDHASINPEEKNKVKANTVLSITEIDSSDVLTSLNEADLVLYNKSTGETTVLYLPAGFKEATAYHIITDSEKKIWIASDQGLFWSDNQLKKISRVLDKSFYEVYLFDYQKRILIGTDKGLFAVSKSEPTKHADTFHFFDGKKINFIGRTPGGLLAIATGSNDLYIIHLEDLSTKIVKKISFDFLIRSFLFEDDDIVWFGSNIGLVKYSIKRQSLKIFSEKDGLANNYIYVVLKGNDGNLWMSTNHGISKFDLLKEKFYNYGLAEGAQSSEFNSRAFCRSSTGEIYFGGVKGINYFNPSKITYFPFDPPLELLNVQVNNKPVSLEKFLPQERPLELAADQNNIAVQFTAIDFNRNANISYLYRLHSKDPWVSNGQERTLSLVNLSGGDYELEVKAQYANSEISGHSLKFSFIVLPPYYKTSWFIAIISLLLFTIIYSIYRYRVSQFLKMLTIRNNIARDLHDDIGSTLGSINMYTEVASGKLKKHEPEEANDVLGKIGLASREMIEHMSDIVWSIHPGNDGFENLYHRMQNFTAAMLTSREIEVNFTVQPPLNKIIFSMKHRKNIFLIFKEAIYNTAKYAEAKNVHIILGQEKKLFSMLIKDDGKGFDSNTGDSYNGNGIKNMRVRAKEIGGVINLFSVKNKGTSVELITKI